MLSQRPGTAPFHIWKKCYHLLIYLSLLWYFRKPREVWLKQCPRCFHIGGRLPQHLNCPHGAVSKEERRNQMAGDTAYGRLHQQAFLINQTITAVFLEDQASPSLRELRDLAQPDIAVNKHYFPLSFVWSMVHFHIWKKVIAWCVTYCFFVIMELYRMGLRRERSGCGEGICRLGLQHPHHQWGEVILYRHF